MIKMNSYLQIKEAITRSKDLVIASHVSPDGDNLGSSLALYLALLKFGKNVKLLRSDTTPEDYLFLPAIDRLQTWEESDPIETFIALDSADLDRLGPNKNLALDAQELINIDHHISNTEYGDLNLVDSMASSTGELVYQLIKDLGIEFDKDIATCLYTAISSDTGSFKYSNTSGRTHEIIGELYQYNLDAANINVKLYQSTSLSKFKLFNLAMENLEFYHDNKLAILSVTQAMLDQLQAKSEDSDGLVESIRDLAPVELAILLKEKDGGTRVSMRSKNYVNVSNFCGEFNGGGHIRASGASIDANVEVARSIILEKVDKYI